MITWAREEGSMSLNLQKNRETGKTDRVEIAPGVFG